MYQYIILDKKIYSIKHLRLEIQKKYKN